MRSVSTQDIYLSKMSGVGDRGNSLYELLSKDIYNALWKLNGMGTFKKIVLPF